MFFHVLHHSRDLDDLEELPQTNKADEAIYQIQSNRR
jgi:hypothetical protein